MAEPPAGPTPSRPVSIPSIKSTIEKATPGLRPNLLARRYAKQSLVTCAARRSQEWHPGVFSAPAAQHFPKACSHNLHVQISEWTLSRFKEKVQTIQEFSSLPHDSSQPPEKKRRAFAALRRKAASPFKLLTWRLPKPLEKMGALTSVNKPWLFFWK